MDFGEILNDARKEAKAKNFRKAIELYEYFFDHALEDTESNFYGVRLSYCLDEWAQIGKEFPKAIDQLLSKKVETKEKLLNKDSSQYFHDYKSINEYLGDPQDSITVFIELHNSRRNLASECIHYIWDELVASEEWEICNYYLESPAEQLKKFLRKFDESMKISKEDRNLGGADFDRQIESWYTTDITNLLLVLKNNNRNTEFETIKEQAIHAIDSRGYSDLGKQIKKNITP